MLQINKIYKRILKIVKSKPIQTNCVGLKKTHVTVFLILLATKYSIDINYTNMKFIQKDIEHH